MTHELIVAGESFIVFLVSIGLLWKGIWDRETLMTESAWGKIKEKARRVRLIFSFSILSLVLLLVSSSAELLNFQTPSPALEDIFLLGEIIHMFLSMLAVLVALTIFMAMERE